MRVGALWQAPGDAGESGMLGQQKAAEILGLGQVEGRERRVDAVVMGGRFRGDAVPECMHIFRVSGGKAGG